MKFKPGDYIVPSDEELKRFNSLTFDNQEYHNRTLRKYIKPIEVIPFKDKRGWIKARRTDGDVVLAIPERYRLATENELKIYKIKNIFIKK
jgi:hypothetical protein